MVLTATHFYPLGTQLGRRGARAEPLSSAIAIQPQLNGVLHGVLMVGIVAEVFLQLIPDQLDRFGGADFYVNREIDSQLHRLFRVALQRLARGSLQGEDALIVVIHLISCFLHPLVYPPHHFKVL